VIGLGEVLWDVFPDSRRPGGAPANVAFQANQLGCRGLIVSRVGIDGPGEELCRELSARGLDLTGIQHDPDHPTGRVTVDLTDSGHPDYVIHENVAWDYLAADAATRDLAAAASAICCGTLAQRSETSRSAIHNLLDAAAPDCLIVYDVNLRQQWYEQDWIAATLRKADVVKLNHEEVRVIANLLGLDGQPQQFAATLQGDFGVDLVCVTRAERGCVLFAGDDVADVPGEPVDVADAVGAGDAFTAALIVSRLDGWPLKAAAEFANRVGGLVASRSGAMPELANEFALLRETFEVS
jgi:fructokinase